MLKAEIKYLFDKMNMNIKDHPYLKIEGCRGNWKLRDTRTKKKRGYDLVYPIGIDQRSIYVINPISGNIESHGFTEDYTGHRSQGYIIQDIMTAKKLFKGDVKTIKIINIKRGKKLMKQRILKTDSPDNYYKESPETQQKLLSWISSNLIEHGGSYRGSYEIQDIFGTDTGIYCSNGTVKQALRLSGFKIKDDRELGNWGVKINKKSPAIVKFYQLEKKH